MGSDSWAKHSFHHRTKILIKNLAETPGMERDLLGNDEERVARVEKSRRILGSGRRVPFGRKRKKGYLARSVIRRTLISLLSLHDGWLVQRFEY